jgi:hypothetical protein
LFVNRVRSAPLSTEACKTLSVHGVVPSAERQLIDLILRCGCTETMNAEAQVAHSQSLHDIPLPIISLPIAEAGEARGTIMEQLSRVMTNVADESPPRNRANKRKRSPTHYTDHATREREA